AGRELARHRWDKLRRANINDLTAEGRVAAEMLRARPRAFTAAVAMAAVRDPSVIESKIEVLSTQGFRDERLDQIANEIVALQLASEAVPQDLVRKRLAARGFNEAELAVLDRAARESGLRFILVDQLDEHV